MGYGMQKGHTEFYAGSSGNRPQAKGADGHRGFCHPCAGRDRDGQEGALYGHIGDGKIFVYDVENVVKVRTGEEATTRSRTWNNIDG
jgi:Amt family ammonium transporter